MTQGKKLQLLLGCISLIAVFPISIYMQYKVLTIIMATDIMWILFWIQWPLVIVIAILNKIIEIACDIE